RLSESFGQQFAIENRGGAGGTIGEEVVAKSAPDGYTILHDATAFSINGSLYGNLAFDYRKDFDPVFLVALVPNILVVTPVGTGEHGCRCDRARQSDARRHRYGIIRQRHAAARVARTASAADRHHDQRRAVSRRRAGDNRCDGWTSEIRIRQCFGGVRLDQGRGKVKAIAHTGKGRLASLPDIPPMSDTLPGFEGYDWNGVF